MGASLVACSALDDKELPPVDALYIGGGFPESHAAALAANTDFRKSLREAVEAGLPVYAECGGLMYLGKELLVEEKVFPMTGVFPFRFVLDKRPQGHGYTILDVDAPNPYFPIGETLHGHEFHYSHIPEWEEGPFTLVFKVKRGQGSMGAGMVCSIRMSWPPIPMSTPQERKAGPKHYWKRPFVTRETNCQSRRGR